MKFLFLLLFVPLLPAHEGPTPLVHYSFHQRFLKNGTLSAQQGPDLSIAPEQLVPTKNGLAFKGTGTTPSAPLPNPPVDSFTITAWCSIYEGTRYGGLIAVHEDNGGFEKGWLLGYDASHFCLTLSTEKTNDGDGKLVQIRSSKPYKKNTFYHLAATYDGKELVLYVNGKKDSATTEVGGKIIYPEKPRVSVAGYFDKDENYPLMGELISAQIYRDVASAKGIAHQFEHNAELTKVTPVDLSMHQPLEPVIAPYLQFTTTNATTVMWETSKAAKGTLLWGETSECKQVATGAEGEKIHEIRIEDLKPGTQYFYRARSEAKGKDGPQTLLSPVRTFQTDGGPGTPFAFAVISDTQGNPKVSGALAQLAWSHRPNFLLHPGDLVSTGGKKEEWVGQFFASMDPLISRVPLFPVLGNHEQNSANYYNYMSLPDPEYYYTFTYGNAQFFMVDTNKKCGPGSEQYQWLDQQLTASKSTWKIVCHHHPAYTSDENDYGDLWKTNKSTRGDLNARHLAHLAHKKGVDLIWNGHIHSYERTWPLQQGKPVTKDGTIHLVTGGGGGHLETPGPFRNGFSQMVQRGHHYAMVWVNGTHLEYKAYTLEGLLFDSFSLRK
jgi:hypothetical protein